MSLNNLKPAKGATKNRKRIARGEGSGSGGTAGKGHKGAKSRSGYKSKRGFEGGQMPLQRRIPKRGFKNPNRVEFRTINLAELQSLAEKNNITEFNFETYRTLKLIKASDKIKVLANGELKGALKISAHAFSDKAKEAIEKNSGTTTLIA
ncbi:MAG: 50S ribosomal protein L15 [Sphingobacteriales bacterium]|nr:50S ribosomal protein L15 [Sphingobacteriales bacterium]MCC6583436.1 50S ribosomal protein L15 [Chitinophagales bacterium]